MTDKELGLKVVRAFYDKSKWNYPFATTYKLEELISAIEKRAGGKGMLEGLGIAVREVGFSDSEIVSAMNRLAGMSGGKIPATNGMFWQALNNQAAEFKFVDAIVYTTTESAKTIVEGAAQVGDQLLLTGKILNFLLPAIILYMVYMWVQKKTK